MKHRLLPALVAACLVTAVPAYADTARDLYTRALAQERLIRDAANQPTLAQMRRVVAAYEAIVRRHPASGYCDNALWQAANVAALAFQRFGNEADRRTATRLFDRLVRGYPSSKLLSQAKDALSDLTASAATPVSPLPVSSNPAPAPVPVSPATGSDRDSSAAGSSATHVSQGKTSRSDLAIRPAVLREVQRTVLADGVRLTVDLDAEVAYHQEEIENPRRVFFDLKNVKAAPSLQDVSLKFDDDVVRVIRLGRHPQNTTRLVVDLDGVSSYTVYPLYGPYRLVMDFQRAVATVPAPAPKAAAPPIVVPSPVVSEARTAAALATLPQAKPTIPQSRPAAAETPLPSKPAPSKALPPVAPIANSNGKFSLSRQLGLGVSRIVIDAGHGGHDPGAHGNAVTEAELTLDVALRVQKLLEKEPGIEVVMTRATDVFIPLEERTAIANRESADLFLSIHANASRNVQARGIETYFLNFAMNPEAEAVAARENATSAMPMHSLPDIVKAIALNNKINESRDLAVTVQKSMTKRLGARNKSLKDLGVKQAPFVVLIGAGMPSVLAEISFVTNRQEGALLKTNAYRQQIAQALYDAVLDYQRGLKRMNAVAGKKATY
jgi:N-acetylmuramoyl-L-alanine amidase